MKYEDWYAKKSMENISSYVNPVNFDEITQYNDKLRPYQKDMKQRVFDAWQSGSKSVMMQMPTGTGKTMVFASIIKDIWNYHFENNKPLRKFLILVHRKELVEQVQKSLYERCGLAHGIIQGGNKENSLFHIQVAMVHTLAREKRLNHWKNNEFDFIICDEAHHFLANDYIKIRNTFPNAYLLGVTATPYRLNHQPFTDYFDVLLKSMPINEFIRAGWLSEYEYYSIEATSSLQLEIDNLRILNTGDYSDNAMSKALDNIRIRAGVVKTWLKYAKGKKTIVYTINQDHNRHLCQEFEKEGFTCVAIDSNTPKEEREIYVERFRKGEITIICNVNIFSEGFDCPDIECIQLARPTTLLAMYLQQVGRGLRIASGKEKTIFLDNVGLYNRFGLPSANRQWQRHFEGEEDWNDTTHNYLEDVKRIRIIDIEPEADDEFLQIYSSVQQKNDRVISNVAEFLGITIEEIIAFFKDNIENINPNTILTDEQYNRLLDYLEKMCEDNKEYNDGFVSIFDIADSEAEKKKNFLCKVKDYKTNKWETVFYKKFIDCYIDVVNRVYCDYLLNIKKVNKKDIESIIEYLKIGIPVWQSRLLINGEEIEANLSNTSKIAKLKYLLSNVGENMFFNFEQKVNARQIYNSIPEIPDNNDSNVEESVTETNEEKTEKKEMEIFANNDIYIVEEMDEKEIIELMLMLHDKVSLEFLDEKKAEERLKQIEKENELQELDRQIEASEYDEEEILRMAERIKQRNKAKQESENNELEEIARKNLKLESETEKKRRKTALNSSKI